MKPRLACARAFNGSRATASRAKATASVTRPRLKYSTAVSLMIEARPGESCRARSKERRAPRQSQSAVRCTQPKASQAIAWSGSISRARWAAARASRIASLIGEPPNRPSWT
jgi:hypothetical protein